MRGNSDCSYRYLIQPLPKNVHLHGKRERISFAKLFAARMASEMAAQANSIKAMCKMPAIESMTATADTLNSYGKLFSDEMEETYSRISEDLEAAWLIENAEEKKEVYSDVPTDEKP